MHTNFDLINLKMCTRWVILLQCVERDRHFEFVIRLGSVYQTFSSLLYFVQVVLNY